jgi:hypothetical protein
MDTVYSNNEIKLETQSLNMPIVSQRKQDKAYWSTFLHNAPVFLCSIQPNRILNIGNRTNSLAELLQILIVNIGWLKHNQCHIKKSSYLLLPKISTWGVFQQNKTRAVHRHLQS